MKFKLKKCIAATAAVMTIAAVQSVYISANAADAKTDIPISDKPLFVGANSLPVLVMLIMSRDHSMYTEAYTDASDVDGDGTIDYYFKPEINYYGLFRSDVCYEYSGGTFVPKKAAEAGEKSVEPGNPDAGTKAFSYCDGSTWSGNFLNYVTTSRMDAVKKVVMGGERLDSDQSIIRHTWIPYDAHSWGKAFVNDYYSSAKGYSPALKVGSFVPTSELGLGQTSDNFGGAFFGVKDYKVYIGIPTSGISIGNMDTYGEKTSDIDRNNYINEHAWIWNWASRESGDGILDKQADGASSPYIIDLKGYTVKLKPCVDDEDLRDKAACRQYPGADGKPVYMPSGLIQQRIAQGAPDFGLITSGFSGGRNIGNGYVRGAMDDASKEIDPKTGKIIVNTSNCTGGDGCGVLPTINMLGVGGFGNKGTNEWPSDLYWEDCWHPRDKKFYLLGDACSMWGNPIGAMLNESYKYFSGIAPRQTGMTSDILTHRTARYEGTVSKSIGYAADVSSPWLRYNTECQNAINLVLSSEDNSFDATVAGGYSIASSHKRDTDVILPLVKKISEKERANSHSAFGASKSKKFFVGGIYDGNFNWKDKIDRNWEDIPSLKPVDDLSEVYGIAPLGLESEGNYDAAGAAYAGVVKYLKGTTNYLKTTVVAMAPSLPRFKIKNSKGQMEIIPVCVTPQEYDTDTKYGGFAPHLRQSNAASYDYLQTCAPVDFYMDYIHYDSDSNPIDMSFRINFEDTESGKDYDEDAIIQYHMWFDSKDPAKAYVSMKGYYSDGYAPQHFGYSVAGVTSPSTFIDMAKSNKTDRTRWLVPKWNGKQFNLVSQGNLDQSLNQAPYNDNNNPVIVRESFQGQLLYQNRDFAYDGSKAKSNDFSWMFYGNPNIQVCRTPDEVNKGYIPLIRGMHDDPIKCMPEVIRTFRVTAKADPVILEPPLLLAARYGESANPDYASEKLNLTTGFYEPKNYFYVSNASTLASQIDKALTEIKKDTAKHVGTSASFSSTDLSGKNVSYYRANFEEAYWTGDVISYRVKNETVYASKENINWKAGKQLAGQYPAGAGSSVQDRRNIFIEDKDGGLHLFKVCDGGTNADNSLNCMDDESYAAIAAGLRAEYSFAAGSPAELDAVKEYVNYMFGDRTLETTEQGENPQSVKDKVSKVGYPATFNGFRNRGTTGSLYGDIQDSTPAYGKTASGLAFIVFGANDGMIHVLSDKTGEELFAIIPHTVAVDGDSATPSSPIVEYAIPGYSHRFTVDGTVNVVSYKAGGKTNVVALGTYGKKFKGGYALNLGSLSAVAGSDGRAVKVADAADIQSLLRWEFDSTAPNDYVGCMLRAPQVFVQKTGDDTAGLYAVYGNGYNAKGDADGNTSALIVVDVVRGKFVNNIVAKALATTPELPDGTYKNGMAEPLVYDYDNDGFADYIYSGDLDGNMYRLTLVGKSIESSSADAVTDADLQRIAVCYDASHQRQSITTRPTAGINPEGNGSVYVSWGTGRFLVVEDGLVRDNSGKSVSHAVNSLYTIVDNFRDNDLTRDSTGVTVSATEYDEESSTAQGSENDAVRKLSFSKTTPKGETFRGLVVDLMPVTSAKGYTSEHEMVIYNPARVDRYFVVNTASPTSDPCKSSAEGYQYVLDLYALRNMNPDSPGDTPVIPSDKQTKFPGFSTDVVITTKRDGGEVTIGTATNVDVGENEGKSKNDAANGGYGGDGGTGDELYGLHQNDLNTEKFKMTSYQFILDNETPW